MIEMVRSLRKHEVSVAPVLVTQKNSFAVLGIHERPFLEKIVPLCAGHVVPLGKLRAIPVDVVLERLRALVSTAAETPTLRSDDADDEQPASADDVLGRLGLRRAS